MIRKVKVVDLLKRRKKLKLKELKKRRLRRRGLELRPSKKLLTRKDSLRFLGVM